MVYFSTGAMKMRRFLWHTGGIIIIILYAILIQYFSNELVPLGADLYGYSIEEIHEIIRNGVNINISTILLFILPLFVFLASFSLLCSRRLIKPIHTFIALGAVILLACATIVVPAGASYETDLSQNLALNKAAYFVGESYSFFTSSLLENDGEYDLQKDEAHTFINIDPDYPFLRVDETTDVLDEYFNLSPKGPPDIVFILVEGLGISFSGPDARLGSFTPFLDEVSRKSLYWGNFLATQGRTFGALPSILGSLPYAAKGFTNLGKRMPDSLTLINILRHNGYRIKYYMSSDTEFDNEGLFLNKQGVDLIVSMKDFEGEYQKSPGIDWNYPDLELMRKTLKTERHDQKEPYLTFIQTISMHSRYSIPNQETYIKRFEERMTELNFNEAQKKEYRLYRRIYSTIMYTDDALRFFFKGYEKLPSYKNSIFIITGDHRLPEIPMITKIERYHVPLIIFSPLLKKWSHIRSISSHLDITPSLLAYLHNNYGLEIPSIVTWLGTGLDTEPAFRNIHRFPLKQTKGLLHDYISGLYFINHNNLFQVMDNMNLESVKDELIEDQLILEFNQYKRRNNRLVRELKLIPDDLYQCFARKG
jgi:uncharacterized sulfatase